MQKNSALLVNGSGSRSTECLTLEPSELLLIDYHCNGLSTNSNTHQPTGQQYVTNNHHLLNNHLHHQLRSNVTINNQINSQLNNQLNQQQFTANMHSSTVNIGTPTNNHCPLNATAESTLINFGSYSNSYTNLINNLNNTYLNNYHHSTTNGNHHLQFNNLNNLNNLHHCHITPHQRAASMYSCHSDTTTATNTTTSSDSELDLNVLTEQLVDDEDDDLNEEELRKLG